jgi:hypothetical protein
MNGTWYFEIIGYLGSILILVSMLMTSVVRLRVINLIGSAIFTVYALLIGSYPTAFLNACLVGINIYQLLKLKRRTGRGYELQKLNGGDGLAEWFMGKYGDDIKKFFPDVSEESIKRSQGFAVLVDDCAAGLLLGKPDGSEFEILLDYTTPAYRDCSVGRFIYDKLPSLGITRLICRTSVPEHAAYLEKMGFTPRGDGSFCREENA